MLVFRKKKEPATVARPSRPIDYPSGLAVRDEHGDTYFVKNNYLLKFYSERVFKTWGLKPIDSSSAALAEYTKGPVLGFRDGTLIHNYADGKVYIISATKRRLIGSPEALERLGLSEADLVYASNAETNLHKEGEPID